MNSHWSVGAFPRNTSNGDYGRFLYATNQYSNMVPAQTGHFSTNGNRMMQHVHYPNCPNQQPAAQEPIPEYTIEYGDEAVRRALGASPELQAQYQKQFGSGGGGSAPIQMMGGDGKSNVTMIPVVFASDDDNNADEPNKPEMNAKVNGEAHSNGTSVPSPTTADDGSLPKASESAADQAAAQNSNPADASAVAEQTVKQKPPKPENILNAFDSARQQRSTAQVKYGRHVRPSYWSPNIPNPCRKKMGGGGGDCMPDESLPQPPPVAPDYNATYLMGMTASTPMIPFSADGAPNMGNDFGTGTDYGFNPHAQLPDQGGQDQIAEMQPKQRARSLPPQKLQRPIYSLCGKCQKCKKLGGGTSETQILNFPKYSSGNQDLMGSHQRKLSTTSSHLGQSAKNFRAIRFSSHHH